MSNDSSDPTRGAADGSFNPDTSVARRVGPPPPPPEALAASRTSMVSPAPGGGTTVTSGNIEGAAGSLLQLPSTKNKIDIAATALRLRDEQVEAKVIYYGADQATNSELDAITDAVIAELRTLAGAKIKITNPNDKSEAEIELIGSLRALLEKLFSGRRETFLRRKLEEIQRRITSLFFNSALFAKISQGAENQRSMSWPDQAVFHALRIHRDGLVNSLKSMNYSDSEVKQEALDRLDGIEKGLRIEFLSRTTPELERLLEIYREVLLKFLLTDFKNTLGEFAWEVIKESRVGQGKHSGYKLGPDVFKTFRETFDKKFVERLVMAVQEPIVARASEMKDVLREESLRFVADPHIFTEICAVVCDAIYDYLYGEGFLELPDQWRTHLLRSQ